MKKWSENDIQQLIEYFNSGKNNIEISILLSRTSISIKRKLSALKLRKNKEWSNQEFDKALNLLKEGKNFKQIGKILNRTQDSVTKKFLRAGYKFWQVNKCKKRYHHINWKEVQEFYCNSTYRGIIKKFNISPQAITWAQKEGLIKLRTHKEAAQKRKINNSYPTTKKTGIEGYRQKCQFKFDLKKFPNEFDFELIKEHGWYKPKNKGNNLNGVSRDHMYSIADGFKNNISPEIIKHPANCKLVLHLENQNKRAKSSITLKHLIDRIKDWEIKYK